VPIAGWAAIGIRDGGFLGLGPYLAAQDYFFGFSYALGAAFGVWAISQFMRQRRAAYATGTAGSVTLVGGLMASGCFLIGCCGSPMLAVYLAIFGAKAVGIGKPLMAGITLFSAGGGYWYLSPPHETERPYRLLRGSGLFARRADLRGEGTYTGRKRQGGSDAAS
jgi:predicted permease